MFWPGSDCYLLFFCVVCCATVDALDSLAPRGRVAHGHEDTVGQDGHHDEEAK